MKNAFFRVISAAGGACALLGGFAASAPAQETKPDAAAAAIAVPLFLPKPPVRPADWLVEHPPVNSNATPEAKALLHFLYQISGKRTLTGQHNYAARQGYSSNLAAAGAGKTRVIYGTDWGFAAAGDKDSAYTRHQTVQTLIAQWHRGSVIALCWHEAPPTEDEPVTFRGSVQSHITDAQFQALLTPGTDVYKHWCVQVDMVAEYLRQLQDAHVPVLWRPLHEINGNWFWWNGHLGDSTHGTKQLYRQLYDRLVNFHHLNNLIWVWNPDRPSGADRQFVDYFPGQNWVDVLGLDCYGAYEQSFYDDLNDLSDGKVLAISETSRPPAPDVYLTQPKWAYYMKWAVDSPADRGRPRPAGAGQRQAPPAPADAPRMLRLQDREYWAGVNPVRAAGGLTPITSPPALLADTP